MKTSFEKSTLFIYLFLQEKDYSFGPQKSVDYHMDKEEEDNKEEENNKEEEDDKQEEEVHDKEVVEEDDKEEENDKES